MIIKNKNKNQSFFEGKITCLQTLCVGSETEGSMENFGITQATAPCWQEIQVRVKEEKHKEQVFFFACFTKTLKKENHKYKQTQFSSAQLRVAAI